MLHFFNSYVHGVSKLNVNIQSSWFSAVTHHVHIPDYISLFYLHIIHVLLCSKLSVYI